MIVAGWRKTTKVLHFVEDTLLSLLLVVMIVLACLQILLRDFFATGLAWADPLLRYMVLWAGLLGAAVATRMDKHIAIDLVSHLVPERILGWLRVVAHLFSMAVCLVLAYAAVVFVGDEAAYGGGQTILGFASWQLNLIFPMAFGLMGLRFLVAAVAGVFRILQGGSLQAINHD
ncbi:MAG: TRAP transporter small permease [Desulfobulbaceae bacterium]|nr:TRAP transporter small permease [Desulfobulbaceae bacterium]HIJ78764.1 TRAP transporter small permease [Deltaproteobacteria bacterium]